LWTFIPAAPTVAAAAAAAAAVAALAAADMAGEAVLGIKSTCKAKQCSQCQDA